MAHAETTAEDSMTFKCLNKITSIQDQPTLTIRELDLLLKIVAKLQKPVAIPRTSWFITFTEDGICWRGSTYYTGTKRVETSFFEQLFARFGASVNTRVPAKYKSKPQDHNILADLQAIYNEILELETKPVDSKKKSGVKKIL
ncbi:hypothetical protein K2P47_02075 [Patescibacteria group bacterium]|nr:hypothetical protein [Patescibacteria group bacterium]